MSNRSDLIKHATMLAEDTIAEHREYGGDLFELMDQFVDGSPYVIHNGQAMGLLHAAWSQEIDAACDTIRELGGYPEDADFWQVQSITAYWVLHHIAAEIMHSLLEEQDA